MNRNRISSFAGFTVLLIAMACVGCAGLFRATVTLTSAVDSASKEYARLFNDGLITADVHQKVTRAHAEYQKAAGVAQSALEAYKLSGDPAQYRAAFEAARQAGLAFVNLIVPHLTPEKSKTLVSNITNATR